MSRKENSSQSLPPLRTLLPAPLRHEHGQIELGKAQEGSGKNTAPKVLTACEVCRKRKTKCTGERPRCGPCLKRSVACSYLSEANESQTQTLKRKYQALVEQQSHASAYQELFELLRNMGQQDALNVLGRIQAGHDIEATVRHVKTSSLLLQLRIVPETRLRYELPYSKHMPAKLLASGSAYLNSLIYSTTWLSYKQADINNTLQENKARYLKPYHAATLIEPRLNRVKPSDWTAVSTDDCFMRELLAAYFTREYHVLPVFQKDIFLEDMAIRNFGTCSSLLVNVLLAYACFCSSKIPKRYAYWDPNGLAYLFLAEARRIWELQVLRDQHRNLASIQAAALMNIVYNLCGVDMIGNAYGFQAFALAKEIHLFDGNEHIVPKALRDAFNFTAWGLFNMDSLLAFEYLRQPFLKHPPRADLPDPTKERDWFGEVWLKYPSEMELEPTYYGLCFKAVSRLRIIVHDLCHASFGSASGVANQQAMEFAKRLVGWFTSLPEVLTEKHLVLPAQFSLHLEYHMIVMMLHQPFQDEIWNDITSPACAIEEAQQNLNILLRIYFLRHSFDILNTCLMISLSKLAFLSLQAINDLAKPHQKEDSRSTLALVLLGLHRQGQYFNIIRTIYKLVKQTAPPTELNLIKHWDNVPNDPVELKDMFISEHVQATWAPGRVSIANDQEAMDLSSLLSDNKSPVPSSSRTEEVDSFHSLAG